MLKKLKYLVMLNLLPPLIYLFLLLLKMTSRVEHIYSPHFQGMWDRGENLIVCFWHGRLLMMPFGNRRGKGKVLISRHRDGEFIARVMGYFQLGAIRGSYRKEGSVSSLREIITDLRNGYDVAITPDGPKGPRYKVKKGIVELAKLTGKAIVPVSYSAGKKKLFIPGTASLLPTHFQGYCFSGAIPSM
ncbi:MAG: hypothetical protein C0392_03485 [Syntrophus sp. (in: bacteria)]|nr:hypothetical protein [Syntrophus sp. (in: bacteria)]